MGTGAIQVGISDSYKDLSQQLLLCLKVLLNILVGMTRCQIPRSDQIVLR